MKQAYVLAGAFAALALGATSAAHATPEASPGSTTTLASGVSANFGDDSIATSFSDTYHFTFSSEGDYNVSLSSSDVTHGLSFSSVTFDGTALTTGSFGGSQFFGGTFTDLAAGTYDVVASGTFTPSKSYASGSYDGTIIVAGVSSAPEPAAWSLMIAGVALVGGALRYGRRNGWASAAA